MGGYTHVFVERETRMPSGTGMDRRIREGLNGLLIGKNEGVGKPRL